MKSKSDRRVENLEGSELFDHPLFSLSSRWAISTSHLTHPNIINWGWGEVVPDGIGVAYSIHPDHITSNTVTRKIRGREIAYEMSFHLKKALIEVFQLAARSKI